jgi:hypothetical protein
MLLACVLLLPACAPANRQAVADWHDAVVAVREQSGVVFRGVNDLVRESQRRRAEGLTSLKEEDFHPGLDPGSIGAWNRALDVLSEYSAALSGLLDPALARGVGDSTKRLGETVAKSASSSLLEKQPGLSSAVGKLGAAIANASAARSAQSIMAQTDPAVAEVLEQMARMISDDSGGMETGIIPTVHTAWTLRVGAAGNEFLRAQNASDKRAVAARYAELLGQRDAADETLLSLRRSLLDLAAAHHRAAAGGSMDTSALIASIREQIAFARALLADLKPAHP